VYLLKIMDVFSTALVLQYRVLLPIGSHVGIMIDVICLKVCNTTEVL